MEDKDLSVLKRYIENRQKYGYSDEELFEMRASFGEDEKVVDVFTGQTIDLKPSRPLDIFGDSFFKEPT
jgi:hypothetical protein